MMDGKALHDVLAEVFSAGEPASGDGPAAVFARAARIRTRQRMIGAAAATAAVMATATVVVGAASLANHGLGGRGGLAVDGPGSGPAAPSTAASAAVKPSTSDPSERKSGVSSLGPPDFDVFDTLTRLLPPGGSIQDPLTQPGFAGVTVVESKGSTRIQVNVQLKATELVGPLIDCGARNLPDGTRCNVVTQPDGTRMLTTDGPNQDGALSIQQLQVDLLYPDGRRVVMSEWNAVDHKRGTITRPTPLLTLDQLMTLATAPDWRM